MSTIIPEKPTTSKPTDTCPPWCDSVHGRDTDLWRIHEQTERTQVDFGKASCRISWYEGRTGLSKYSDKGPQIFFATEPKGSVLLTAAGARGLAMLLDELGVKNVAAMLRQAADLAGGAQ